MTEWKTEQMTEQPTKESTMNVPLPESFQDELLPLGAAFLRMAERRAGRALSEEVALTTDALMRAFAEASHRGSVCVRRQDLLMSLAERMSAPFDRDIASERLERLFDELEALGLLLRREGAEVLETLAAPWIEDGERIYAARYFAQEASLAAALVRIASQTPEKPSEAVLSEMRRLTDAIHADEHQAGAVLKALEENLAVICGGPGTGKTTSVVLMLECLLAEKPNLRIYLAAPTGKATSRMAQSIQESVASDRLVRLLPRMGAVLAGKSDAVVEGRTLHKWLVTKTASGERPSKTNPLPCDVLVIDEASMVDIHLAARLFEAVSPKTRVIVLGDKFQLAAVGPGAVFADISSSTGALARHVAELKTSRRFKEKTVIWSLARAVNHEGVAAKDAPDDVVRLLRANLTEVSPEGDICPAVWFDEAPQPDTGLSSAALEWLDRESRPYLEALAAYVETERRPGVGDAEMEEAWTRLWKSLARFRPLAAQRRGPQSVEALNRVMESRVKAKLVEIGAYDERYDDEVYPGRVVIVRKNDDVLGVFNGDVGIVVPVPFGPDEDPLTARPRRTVIFGDTGKRIAPSLLPAHETAFAITIHQSQGSEFEHVAVFLPEKPDSGLATRELLYTGVTRTKGTVTIFGSERTLRTAVASRTARVGGLARRLEELVLPKETH